MPRVPHQIAHTPPTTRTQTDSVHQSGRRSRSRSARWPGEGPPSGLGAGPTGNVTENGLGETSVDADILAGDISCQGADKELDHVRDIHRVANLRQRDDFFPCLLDFGIKVHFFSHLRASHARGYDVYADSVRSPFQCECLSHHRERSLGWTVCT